MILKFTFLYKKSNKNYFLKILQNVATSHNLKHYDMLLGDDLLFFINGSEQNLHSFSTAISSKIPLSLYFIIKSVEVAKEMVKNYATNITTQTTIFDFTLDEMLVIKDINSAYFCDIFTYPACPIAGDILYNGVKISTKESLKDSIYDIWIRLKNGESVVIETIKGRVELSLNSDSFDCILANDISTISLYTCANKDELEALATYEKPSIELKIKDIFASELGFGDALFVLPYDMILSILFSVETEIPFLYVKHKNIGENSSILYENPYSESFFEIVLGENGYFIQKDFLCDDLDSSAQSSISIIKSGFCDIDKTLFVSYISSHNESVFGILDSGNIEHIINIHFDMNPKNILQKIEQKPNGKKLVANYSIAFKERMENIERFGVEPIWTNNITDIFAPISVILGFDLNKDMIYHFVAQFLRDIGPRIDFKNINIDDKIYYDSVSSVQSSMSFALAGIDNETLCYGVFDSLADFVINLIRDVSVNYNIKDVGIMGDLFANKIFFRKITKKLSAESTLYFPKFVDKL